MRGRRLVIQSLRYYWKRHLWLAAGVAISTAVLTGGLIVGDSVKYSLSTIVDKRLGSVTHALRAGDRYFTTDLTHAIAENGQWQVANMLQTDGLVVAEGGRFRLNDVVVYGIDEGFDRMAGTDSLYGNLVEDEVIISQNIADRLNLSVGDELLVRMNRASLIPKNAPFVSDVENDLAVRCLVTHIAVPGELGYFNLKNSQTAPFNVFINAAWLRRLMQIGNYANLMLFAGNQVNSHEVLAELSANWKLEDAGLTDRKVSGKGITEIISNRVFIDPVLAEALKKAFPEGQLVTTYFVNRIQTGNATTPYSFVSTLPGDQIDTSEIIINNWLANDLEIGIGDSIIISYYVIGPLRSLEERSHTFKVSGVVAIEGEVGDRFLMPEIPGLSDAGNCRDWEAGVPISLDEIRDRDEDYWTKYGGTPKAYISREMAERLWSNRFGTYTAFRIKTEGLNASLLQEGLLSRVAPAELGYEVVPVRDQADYAAANGVDFSELFGGLSFFLLASAILLAALLFLLNLEERASQLSTLRSLGIPSNKLRNLYLIETIVVSAIGSIVGLGLAVIYNELVFDALNSIWSDIVRTEMLMVNITTRTLITGYLVSIIFTFLSVYIPYKKYTNTSDPARKFGGNVDRKVKLVLRAATVILLLLAGLLVGSQLVMGDLNNPVKFFASGGLILTAGLLIFYQYTLRISNKGLGKFRLSGLSMKNTVRNRNRSLTIVILFSLATFVVISTGSNRKDLFVNASDPSSGTGGYLYYAESTIPVLREMDDPDFRNDMGLDADLTITQFRIAEGDDASCLNLNRIVNPRIIAVDPAKLSGRFSFVTKTEMLDKSDPWLTLSHDFHSGAIPAIADETVIKWGLGLSVGDTLFYRNANGEELCLVLVGGLAPSIFQGNVIISESHFLENFPTNSGSGIFLVDGAMSDTASIRQELERSMRDFGWTMELAGVRLTEFNSITNTYLSIFLVLGALGLLLGTVGLSVVLYRSVLERRSELALLRSVGYSLKTIRLLIFREYASLLIFGILLGGITAFIATLPSLLSPHTGISARFVILILIILVANGLIWIGLMSGMVLGKRTLNQSLRSE